MRFDELLTELEIEARQWRLGEMPPFAELLRATMSTAARIRSANARRMIGLGAWLGGEAVGRVATARRTG